VSDPVRLRVQFTRRDTPEAVGDDLDAGPSDHEDLVGVPVDAEGTFRLESSSFFVPLAAGDLVRAAADATDQLQVVDVVEPYDAVLTIFAPDASASPEAIAGLMRIWEATGAGHSERGGPFVATVWPGMPMDAIAAQLNADQAAGRGEWILAAEPHERRREAQDEIAFELS
jgi:hypothetical protein